MVQKINITVLVAPLDWGLGHCTRIIPLVHYFQQKGCRVILAAEGAQAKLLHDEFPGIKMLPLQGYRISYSPSKRLFAFKIVQQLPKVLKSIKTEQKWLNRVVEEEKIDVIISDNRYGLYHTSKPSFFITHQLHVQTPFAWAEKIVQKIIYSYINRYTACLVPDANEGMSVAGKLAHPALLPGVPVKYMGPISRFQKEEDVTPHLHYAVLILLSGPEPQRTVLENIIIKQLQNFKGKVLMVRGLPGCTEKLVIQDVEVINHLPSADLQKAISQSAIVISRSGYSTVMDLCKLQKQSILIPTPGQTEQEYLGKYLAGKGWCLSYPQDDFVLADAVLKAQNSKLTFPVIAMDGYKKIIDELLEVLHHQQKDKQVVLPVEKL